MTAPDEKRHARRFLRDRPDDLRSALPWHRYSHHIRTFPARLEALAPQLEVEGDGRVLDYGCADVPYRRFFAASVDFVPADLEGNPNAELILNPDGTVPAADESFDAVLSTQVLEHVGDPALYLSECFRVLRSGGRLMLSTHGAFVYHPDPVDYWRWTGAGLHRIVSDAGFEVIHQEGIIGLIATGLQFVQDALYYKCPAVVRPVFALTLQTLMGIADRLEGQESKDLNASVFAVIAARR